jgi:ABC-type multidrug transport system ATPase subunit
MALAMLGDPEIYIMDEPMSGLDPIGRKLFRDIFRELAQKEKCIFFSTHILEDIETICDDIIAISKGSLVYSGPIKDILSKYSTGMEITVPKLPEETISALSSMGCQTTVLNKINHLIYIESEKEYSKCQEFLYLNKIFPLSIKARVNTLENIINKIYS